MLVTNFNVKYVLYKVVCAFYQLADVGLIHPMRERSIRALNRTVDYIEELMPDALGFENQRELTAYALKAAEVDGHYLEFGVFTGGTMRFIAARVGGRKVHGFDSFEGLPQDWGGFNLGRRAFDVGGKLPRVPANVELHRGWFDDSLPPWLAANPGPVAFIHVDCDLYSSTRTIFQLLGDRIGFWHRHPVRRVLQLSRTGRSTNSRRSRNSWRSGEMKYTYLGYARQQVLVRINSVDGPAR